MLRHWFAQRPRPPSPWSPPRPRSPARPPPPPGPAKVLPYRPPPRHGGSDRGSLSSFHPLAGDPLAGGPGRAAGGRAGGTGVLGWLMAWSCSLRDSWMGDVGHSRRPVLGLLTGGRRRRPRRPGGVGLGHELGHAAHRRRVRAAVNPVNTGSLTGNRR